MKLLALDTATEACSAALLVDGELRTRRERIGRGHAERLLPMAAELLREGGLALAELDALAVGRGPGAFTGVRIAVSVAQGLALGAGLPVVPVSDLWALGAAALERAGAPLALACLDARMGEVYWGLVRRREGALPELLCEGLAPPAQVPVPDPAGALVGAGHGWSAYPELGQRFERRLAGVEPALLPDAAWVARLAVGEFAAGRAVAPAQLEPTYLRNDVATRSTRAPLR